MAAVSEMTAPPKASIRHIPGPNALPLIGKTISFVRDPYGTYFDQTAKFGPVFRMTVFGYDWVVLAGPDALEHVYLDRERVFSAKHGLTAFAEMFSGGLLQRDFDDHRSHRRVMQAAFKAPVMRNYLGILNTEISSLLDQWQIDTRFSFAPAVKELTLRLGAHLFMGVSEPAEIDRLNRAFIDEVQASTALIRWPLPFTRMRKGIRARELLSRTFLDLIAERRVKGGDDFFSQLCIARDDEGHGWSDQDIVDHFNFLLVAAHDAVTGALTAMAWAMGKYPDWQDQMIAEIRALGPGPLSYDALDQLPVTDRVYREALRLFAPSAFTARAAMQDTHWQGHDIPAGARVVLCPGPVMMSPELWTDPTRFDPGRFAPDRAEHARHKYAWSPFGGGAHKCIGMHFSSLQVKAFMVQFLQKYRVEMDPKDDPIWQQLPTPLPKNGLPLVLRTARG